MNERRAAEVLRRVRSVPEGRVTTYGDLSPGAPRFAGTVLSECHEPDVPWHRIVRADGSLAQGDRQRRLLDAEGVPFQRRARGHARGLGAGALALRSVWTIRRSHGLLCDTLFGTLPKIRFGPCMPTLPITIRSAPRLLGHA